jgi:hypothetical protein
MKPGLVNARFVAAATGSINIVLTDSVKGWFVKEMLTLYVVVQDCG